MATNKQQFVNFIKFLHGTDTPTAELRVTSNKWIYNKEGKKMSRQLFGGVFSNLDKMYKAAMEMSGAELSPDDKGNAAWITGVYVGINPPEIGKQYTIPVKNWEGGVSTLGTLDLKVGINNSCGYLTKKESHRAVNDDCIAKRSVIFIDIDSKHPVDMAATTDAKAKAVAVSAKVLAYLKEHGITCVGVVDSGNGIHIYIPVNFKNSAENETMIIQFLSVLGDKFTCEDATIDPTVFNASRISRLPFTLNSKGIASEECPWRTCTILELPEPDSHGYFYCHPMSMIQEIANEAREDAIYQGSAAKTGVKATKVEIRKKQAKLLAFFEKFDIDPINTEEKSDGTYYFVECPWQDAPDSEAFTDDVNPEDPHQWITPDGKEVIDAHSGESNGTDVAIRVNGDGYSLICKHTHGPQVHWKDYRLFYDDGLEFPMDETNAEMLQAGIDSGLIEMAPYKVDEGEGESEDNKELAVTTPVAGDEKLKVYGAINLSDLGNAKRLVRTHGHNLRYCASTKTWYLWNTRCWVKDEKGYVVQWAANVVQNEIMKEAKAAAEDARVKAIEEGAEDDESDKVYREVMKSYRAFALASESKTRLEAMITLTRSERGIPLKITDFDNNGNVLNLNNGVVNLDTLEVKPACRADLSTKISRVNYDPTATCPQWEKFLATIFAKHPELVDYFQRIMGYSLTAKTIEQCYFLFYGTGANGKSTLLNIFNKLLGEYSQTAEFSTFIAKSQDGGVRNDLAKLCGARMVMASESDQNKRMSEGMLKQVTGEDVITARFLYGEFFEFQPSFKLMLATNHKPKVVGQDNGYWRRVRLIPFDVTIPKEEQNKNINNDLEAELSGILNWALEGLRMWKEQGLNDPEIVLSSTREYRDDEDALEVFIDEECEVSKRVACSASGLYEAYARWAKNCGEFVMNTREFKKRLLEKGFTRPPRGASGYRYSGLCLRHSGLDSDEVIKEVVAAIN